MQGILFALSSPTSWICFRHPSGNRHPKVQEEFSDIVVVFLLLYHTSKSSISFSLLLFSPRCSFLLLEEVWSTLGETLKIWRHPPPPIILFACQKILSWLVNRCCMTSQLHNTHPCLSLSLSPSSPIQHISPQYTSSYSSNNILNYF